MNLLECLAFYQLTLKGNGRTAAADSFLKDVVAPELHHHIEVCFDDEGNALHTIIREDEDGNPLSTFEDGGIGGFQFTFENPGDYLMEE